MELLARRVTDRRLMLLVRVLIDSYSKDIEGRVGLPLGNVTSQLFANIYLDGLDHFIKDRLRLKWYLRFCDDFIIVYFDRTILEQLLPQIKNYLWQKRRLELHPKKVSIRKYTQGIDFVGQVVRPHVTTLRTKTKRRLLRRMGLLAEEYRQGLIEDELFRASLQFCLGILGHGDNYKERKQLRDEVSRFVGYIF